MNNVIDTIIFDIGNVLVDFCWRKVTSGMGLLPDIQRRLEEATVLNQMWNEFDRGLLSEDEILEGFIRNDPEIEDVIRRFFFDEYPGLIQKFDYANEWIDYYKEKGYKIYFLSNFSEKGFREMAKDLDFVEKGDGAVISYREKLIKPDESIYKVLMERYNVVPEKSVFLDDTKVNTEAAKALGFNVIEFCNREQALQELKKLGVE